MKKEVITSRMLLDNGQKSNEAQDIKEEYDLSDEELSILIKGMENIENGGKYYELYQAESVVKWKDGDKIKDGITQDYQNDIFDTIIAGFLTKEESLKALEKYRSCSSAYPGNKLYRVTEYYVVEFEGSKSRYPQYIGIVEFAKGL